MIITHPEKMAELYPNEKKGNILLGEVRLLHSASQRLIAKAASILQLYYL